MTSDSLRERLVQSLEAAQAREAVLLALCDDSPPTAEGVWTVKDNVAHLSIWREHAVRTLDAARMGTDYDGPANDGDVDAQNAEIYEAHRGDSAATVRAAAPASYAALIAAIRACSEDDLLRERANDAGPVWRVVPGNGHAHVAQHLSYWAAERGDAAGAEEAARWGYTLDTELFPDNQAVADYNFACFHARNGHADEALPLLQAALRARPDLRAFAVEDADIEPIRNDPRVESLLGARRSEAVNGPESEAGDEMLRDFLRGQRESILAIVEGLDEEAWHRSVVPTGWTPAGMLEHLGGAEWHWFQGVVAGKEPELPGDLDEDQPPYDPLTVVFTSDEPSTEVIAFYREQCAQSEAVLDATPLSAQPLGKHNLGGFVPPNIRWVVLHMIEETARHIGHLDIARELLDGRTRLGGR